MSENDNDASEATTKAYVDSSTSIELGQQGSGLPLLPYNLRNHKKSIAINWILIVADSCLLPIVLYYSLNYDTNLRPAIIFAIITSVAGIVSPIKYFFGILRMIRHSKYRPAGGMRFRFDYFHISFAIGYAIYLMELIIGTAPNTPIIRLLSLPTPSLVFIIAFMIMIPHIYYLTGLPLPFRVSTQAKGEPARPGIYPFVEDVVAVEGFGGLEWREALDKRYQASPYFRRTLSKLTVFWVGGSFAITAACVTVIAVAKEPIGYGVGWILPFAWAALWTFITIEWTRRMLRKEKRLWNSQT